MSLRVGGWLGALAILTIWWFVSLGDPPTARERAQRPAASPTSETLTISPIAERLKRGLANRPAAPSPRRNPFQFGSRELGAPPMDEASSAAVPPPPVVTPPAFTLAGIATSDTPEGPVRTAVVSTGRGAILAKVGDELPNGARVVRVEEDHMVIVDAAGTETFLRLK